MKIEDLSKKGFYCLGLLLGFLLGVAITNAYLLIIN